MPIYDKHIPNPVLDGQRRPLSFRWRGQVLHVVEVIDRFVVTGEWWEQKPECVWWRVRVRGGGLYELYYEQGGERRWMLYKVYD
jgi:hypothetical protein